MTWIDQTKIPHEYFLMRQRYDQCLLYVNKRVFFFLRFNFLRVYFLFKDSHKMHLYEVVSVGQRRAVAVQDMTAAEFTSQ